MPFKYWAFATVFFLAVSTASFGQGSEIFLVPREYEVGPNPIRLILNKFSFSLTLGYGRTFYSHQLPGYGVVKKEYYGKSGLYLFTLSDLAYNQDIRGVKNWLNNPSDTLIQIDEFVDGNQMVLGDTIKLGFNGNSAAYPVSFTLQYSFMDRFRVGGGISYEYHRLPIMSSSVGTAAVGEYIPDIRSSFFLRYFGTAAGKVYQWMDISYFVDVQVGKANMGRAFNKSLIEKGLFFNIGAPIEYRLSEYLQGFLRPSFEFKSYRMQVGGMGAINHLQPAFYLHFGFRYNIPELPRCKLKVEPAPGYTYPKNFTNKTCRIQKKHVHGDQAFRGQPFYKEQNPEIGQNYPQPVRRKWLNRRKLSQGY